MRATIPVGEAPRKIVLLPASAAAAAPKPASAQPDPTASQTVANVEVRTERFRFGPPATF